MKKTFKNPAPENNMKLTNTATKSKVKNNSTKITMGHSVGQQATAFHKPINQK